MEPRDANPAPNKVICPRCGEVRLETPPGTTALPTIGQARKASGAAGECECGRSTPRWVEKAAAEQAESAGDDAAS